MSKNEYPPREEVTREQWESYQQELLGLRDALFDSHFVEVNKKIVEFTKEIRERFPDYDEYLAYHVPIWSTPFFEHSPKLDFPEPLSVKSFLEKLKQELVPEAE